MEIPDPVVVYNAESNTDADYIQQFLQSNDIQAYSVEDNSLVGYWMGGTLPGIHKPQVWVSKTDVERATLLIQQHLESKQTKEANASLDDAEPIVVVCDECGAENTFPGSLAGTVQDCKKCASYLDVGEIDWPYDADFGEPES